MFLDTSNGSKAHDLCTISYTTDCRIISHGSSSLRTSVRRWKTFNLEQILQLGPYMWPTMGKRPCA